MTPQFALDLSMEGIALLTRGENGLWHRDGAVRLDDPDFKGGIDRLRDRCIARAGEGFASWLIIPDSQLLFTTLERDDRRPEVTIRQNLQGRTPYEVDELVFDFIERGDRLEVVVVAQETLIEAETFAIDHGFRPVATTANPADGQFRKAPWFGATSVAEDITGGETITRMEGLFELASSALPPIEPADVPAEAEIDPPAAPMGAGNPSDVAHVADLLAQARPAAPPEPARPEAVDEVSDDPPAPDAEQITPDEPQSAAPEAHDNAEEQPGAGSEPLEPGQETVEASPDDDATDKRPAAPVAERGRVARPAPGFSTRRRSRIVSDSEADALSRIAPRLTGVTRGSPKPRATSEKADPATATPEAFETAIAKAARMARDSVAKVLPAEKPTAEMQAADREEMEVARKISSARLRPSRLVTAVPIDAPAPDTAATLAAAETTEPAEPDLAEMEAVSSDIAPPSEPTPIDGKDEFVLEPFITSRLPAGVPGRYGLYAAALAIAALLGVGGWAATKFLFGETVEQAGTQTGALVDDAQQVDLAALLPEPSGAADRSQPEIVAPAPVVVARVDPADASGGSAPEADEVRAQLDVVGLPPQPDTEAAAAPVARPAEDVARAPETTLTRPAPPTDTATLRDGPATPQSTTPVAAPAAPDTEVAAVEGGEPAAIAPLSLIETDEAQAQAQVAALEALLAAPVDAEAALAPSPAPETETADAGGAASDDDEAEPLTTVAASSSPSTTLPETDEPAEDESPALVAATAEGTVAPGGYRVIAGRPDVVPAPRPGVENVETVAAASATEAEEETALDPEEQARRAVLSRVRPTIRPREVETETDETQEAEADAEPVEATEEESEAVAALRAFRPQPRPANRATPETEAEAEGEPEAEAPSEIDPAIIAAEEAATASLAAARAAAEAADRAEAEAARVSPLALARSERPGARPRGVERTAARIVERRREAAATPASAPAAPARSTDSPSIRSAGGNVARAATVRNQVRLNRIALIGTYGAASNRRALVRMGNGRYVKVEVGDRLDRGRVIAIGDGVVRYQRGGRNMELKMPPI